MFFWRYIVLVSLLSTVLMMILMLFDPIRRPIISHVGGDVVIMILLLVFGVCHFVAQVLVIRFLFSKHWSFNGDKTVSN
jgi:hypothetical protein